MTPTNTLRKHPLSLGLTQWSTPQWRGQLFSEDEAGRQTLFQYSHVFDCVEGNTTFYALPSEATVNKWQEQVPEDFEFCFKFPQAVTHRGYLDPEHPELQAFFQRIEALEQNLGPFMVQLPASISAEALSAIAGFLDGLPQGFRYSLEVRHPIFFQKGEEERQLNRILTERGIDRTSLDSRALFSAPADSEAMIDAHKKKPRLPVHAIATGERPMIRFIGRMEAGLNSHYWQPWIKKINQWLGEDKHPIIFIHTPDNLQAPNHAQQFYQELRQGLDDSFQLPELPPFPAMNTRQDDMFSG